MSPLLTLTLARGGMGQPVAVRHMGDVAAADANPRPRRDGQPEVALGASQAYGEHPPGNATVPSIALGIANMLRDNGSEGAS